jgi:hypothetical protein
MACDAEITRHCITKNTPRRLQLAQVLFCKATSIAVAFEGCTSRVACKMSNDGGGGFASVEAGGDAVARAVEFMHHSLHVWWLVIFVWHLVQDVAHTVFHEALAESCIWRF